MFFASKYCTNNNDFSRYTLYYLIRSWCRGGDRYAPFPRFYGWSKNVPTLLCNKQIIYIWGDIRIKKINDIYENFNKFKLISWISHMKSLKHKKNRCRQIFYRFSSYLHFIISFKLVFSFVHFCQWFSKYAVITKKSCIADHIWRENNRQKNRWKPILRRTIFGHWDNLLPSHTQEINHFLHKNKNFFSSKYKWHMIL